MAKLHELQRLTHQQQPGYQGNDREREENELDEWVNSGQADQPEDDYPTSPRFKPTPIFNPLNLLKTGAKVLDDAEIRGLRPVLIEAITYYSEEADKLISQTNRQRTVISEEAGNLIWSSLEADEIETLVDATLVIGKRQPHVAMAIREIARTWKMVQAGIILVPRFIKTLQFYADNGGIGLW